MRDLEIRLAHAVSASLAPPANPDQPPIRIKGRVTHVLALQANFFWPLDRSNIFHFSSALFQGQVDSK
jgi:hypothetical protein